MSSYEPSIESRPLRAATDSERKLLRELNTSDLVSEVMNRTGVDVIVIPPYTKVHLTIDGCATVLKVVD